MGLQKTTTDAWEDDRDELANDAEFPRRHVSYQANPPSLALAEAIQPFPDKELAEEYGDNGHPGGN